jgi:ATP-dependent exoDNAse (exonuclease V) beta subunit
VSASQLNVGQQAAVDSAARRIVVSAGAGSGKTRVLAVRFADAVIAGETAGEESPMRAVLLITFTEKAAGELVERVRRVFLERGRPDLAREVAGAWISTIHGFCARIVRRHALELGVDPAFGVLADPQVGVVRMEAFERATTTLLSDAGIARLVELHGPAALRTMTQSAYGRIRSMGASVADVAPCAAPDLLGALRLLIPVLQDTVAAYGDLKPTATIGSNTGKFVTAIEAAKRLVAGEGTGPTALEVAGLHPSYKGGRQGGEEMRTLTEAANAALERASQAGVDTLAAAAAASWLDLLDAYAMAYEDAKASLGVLDFEDLQLLTRRLWLERPDAAERYSRQFAQVMIDEFQDTNELQFEAIRPVAGRGLCIVGDVQQSIYRFRDADVGLFIDQKTAAEADEAAQSCQLTVNYRSHPELLTTLNALFEGDGFFGAEYLHLDDGGERPSGVQWPAGEPRTEAILVDKAGWEGASWREIEAQALARRLRALVDQGRMAPDDIVVLARAMTTAGVYVDALRTEGFEVYAGDAGGFYAAPEVADIRSLLRVLANPLDGEGVLGLLAGGFGGLSDDALCLLATSAPHADLWHALPAAAELGVGPGDAKRAARVCATIGLLRERLGHMRLADAILYAVSELGGEGGCAGRTGAHGNVRKAVRLAAEFERTTPADPAAFLRYLADRETYVRKESSVGSAVEGAGAVRVMSVHGAKGLEFPVVVMADLGHGVSRSSDAFSVFRDGGSLTAAADVARAVTDKAPEASAWKRGDEEEGRLDLEESKRVFYVACTRAEQVLILTGSTRLDKPPGTSTDVDRLRSAIDGAGPFGIPGLLVTKITAAEAPEPQRAIEPAPLPRTARGAGSCAPAMVLRDPDPIAAPTETSYTALALYERCAYRFFAERMLGVGTVDAVGGDDPRAFGSALHGALQTVAEGRVVDEDRLRALAATHGLGDVGIARLSVALDAFTASPAGGLLGSGRAEVPFNIRVAGGIVAGSMDLVVREGDAVTVVDYKTGSSADADATRYAPQADIYALALLVAGCTEVTVRFVRVEVDCAETVFRFGPADRERITSRIEEAFARMGRGEFGRLASFDAGVCPDCPVSGGLCPVVHPGSKGSRDR